MLWREANLVTIPTQSLNSHMTLNKLLWPFWVVLLNSIYTVFARMINFHFCLLLNKYLTSLILLNPLSCSFLKWEIKAFQMIGHIVTNLCMNVYLLPFCFPAFSWIFICRLEDFPTSPTSTAKQEFLYVIIILFHGLCD